MTVPHLVGDVGATNARFARVADDGKVIRIQVFSCEDYLRIDEAIETFLAEDAATPRPEAAAIGIAGPVTGDRIALTNHPWSFSTRELKQRLRLDRLDIVNDFAANALAIPHLTADQRVKIGGGSAVDAMPVGVIGPGSGLGVSGLTPFGNAWRVIDGEGGHATMAAATDREAAVLDRMRSRFDHVSAERVLSGPGLVNLYNTLAEVDGVPAVSQTPAQVADPETTDERCHEAVALFCAMLGTVAGNLALTIGARGGIYIAGGIVPKLGERFAASGFRQRFEDKGRMRPYLEMIPTFVITDPIPAFIGLTALLAD
jgi:glucokinase